MPFVPNAEDSRYRLKQMILYIAQQMQGAEYFGATKFNKILFRVEFAAYRELGSLLTGYKYQKNTNGPTLRAFLPVTAEMEKEGDLTWEERDHGAARPERRAVAISDPDLTVFQEAELAIMDREVSRAWSVSGGRVSEEEHRTAAWFATRMGETIQPQLAFVEDPGNQVPLSPAEEERAKSTYDRRIARTGAPAGNPARAGVH